MAIYKYIIMLCLIFSGVTTYSQVNKFFSIDTTVTFEILVPVNGNANHVLRQHQKEKGGRLPAECFMQDGDLN